MIASANADWANVLVALIVGLPGLISAVYAITIHRKIKTPSGSPIGHQVENNLHTVLANNYRLRSISAAVKAPESVESHIEAEKVPDLPEGPSEPKAQTVADKPSQYAPNVYHSWSHLMKGFNRELPSVLRRVEISQRRVMQRLAHHRRVR